MPQWLSLAFSWLNIFSEQRVTPNIVQLAAEFMQVNDVLGIKPIETGGMDARLPMRRPLVCGATFCLLAFLVCEPLKPEILLALSHTSGSGWPIFALVRLTLIWSAVGLFYYSLPSLLKPTTRPAPMPMVGNDPLLSLRAFACMLVFAGHGFAVVFVASGMSERLARGSRIWLIMGSPWAGVWVFFVLSGYLMAKGFYRGRYALSRSSVLSFYKNRLLRIVPIYYLVLFLAAIFSAPQIFTPVNWWQIFALGLFSQQIGSPIPVITALWSIQTEMAFYAAVPIFILGIGKVTKIFPVWLPIVLLLSSGLAYRWWVMAATINLGWLDRIYVPLIGNLDLFLIGMLANWALPEAQRVLKCKHTLSLGFAVLGLLYLVATFFFARTIFGPDSTFYSWGIIVPGPALVGLVTFGVIILFEHHVSIGHSGSFVARKLVRGTQMIGVLTYALYSWHEPIFLHLRGAAGGNMTIIDAAGWVLMALLLTAIVAYVSFRLVEAPFERRKTAMPPEAHVS